MKEKILEKLRKMVAHAESASAIGSTAEAEAFGAKIQSLLDEHNLSMDDVELHAVENSPIDAEAIYGPSDQPFSRIDPWQGMILNCIAQINGCFSAESPMGFLIVVGHESDRKLVINFYRYFERLGKQMAADYESSFKRTIEYQMQNVSFYFNDPLQMKLRSYMTGFGSAVCERLNEVYGSDSKAAKHSKALVSLNRRATESEKWIREKVSVGERDRSEVQVLDRSDFEDGVAAGRRVAVTEKILA